MVKFTLNGFQRIYICLHLHPNTTEQGTDGQADRKSPVSFPVHCAANMSVERER